MYGTLLDSLIGDVNNSIGLLLVEHVSSMYLISSSIHAVHSFVGELGLRLRRTNALV